MLSVSGIDFLSPVLSARALTSNRPADIAAEFDAMVLEVLLRQSGLLRSLSAVDGAQTPLIGEMFLQSLARELAAQVDLGLGGLLVRQADRSIEGGA